MGKQRTASRNEWAVNTFFQNIIMQNEGKTEMLEIVSPEF